MAVQYGAFKKSGSKYYVLLNSEGELRKSSTKDDLVEEVKNSTGVDNWDIFKFIDKEVVYNITDPGC